ncbi:hypothetical protein MKQ70_23020 [Chitinophaga sedimenti]|nr:hypothetical protein [Chitinophaga sedimenti]MCK7557721.1 hypothetical protein [Chitinophaga sedimenti]
MKKDIKTTAPINPTLRPLSEIIKIAKRISDAGIKIDKKYFLGSSIGCRPKSSTNVS